MLPSLGVWQARDTTLDRNVALEVLPEAFTADPDRLARFEREAKVLASLNHPNIGSIYGLEKQDGVRALVLELVEGPTLADRIKQGPIPLDEALPIATQIAEALEAAHEAGVIHRDLKLANIKVRTDGTVKVLDFGLAKAFQPDASDPNMSMSPTISLPAAATQMGMVIGTAAYMAPEQAKGKVVDKRADVWEFGVVLFEMLSGTKPFAGDDVADTLAAVLRAETNWTLVLDCPVAVQQLLRRCLQKDPRERLAHIGEARYQIKQALSAPDGDTGTDVTRRNTLRPPRRSTLIAAAVVGAVVAGVAVWGLEPVPATLPRSPVRFMVPMPPGTLLYPFGNVMQSLVVSPTGHDLVYTVVSNRSTARTDLTVRSLGRLGGTVLDGLGN